ncbi:MULTISPECIES: LytR/AlgR family response regulator transcription factor [Niastella]|uniref:Response regulator transcription factor n=1 Tax=Niastella soli TaxID=2821487 RepID=A0ABS3Z1A5_9BACT|nr:LytTR family DNA-binding domain-containing protein [Niastella soli]MBO9203944.1 response regulator transcription factor [Niastella soli]
MTCLIIDDNAIARSVLKKLATQVQDLVVAGECTTAMEGYNYLQEHTVDFLLLDIEMPGMTGLELTRNLGNKKPVIVFTTSNKEYALEAFELNVADYLLKPVTAARFLCAIEKVRQWLGDKEAIKVTDDPFIFVRDSNIVRQLKLDEILYAEAMGDYVKLFTAHKFYAIHTTLKAVEERLSSLDFIRTHRSYLIALNKIDVIQDGALVVAGKSIPVADAYRKALNKRLNIL